MRVIGFDPQLPAASPVWAAHHTAARDLAELLGEADVVSLHTPLTKDTRGMIGAKFFGAMKKGTYFVNTARGAIVNIPDLLAVA